MRTIISSIVIATILATTGCAGYGYNLQGGLTNMGGGAAYGNYSAYNGQNFVPGPNVNSNYLNHPQGFNYPYGATYGYNTGPLNYTSQYSQYDYWGNRRY